MTVSTVQPVRRQITVHAPQQTAFDVFTRGMGRWWKPSHHIGEQPFADVVIEPQAGGRWFERDADGAECDWGTVVVWEPPARVVLGWQLDAQWRHDPGLLTEVEVRFVAEQPDVTRVELEHRDLDRFGDDAEEVRQALDSDDGWNGLLALYQGQLAQA